MYKINVVFLVFYHNYIALCRKKKISPSAAAVEMGFRRSAVTRWAAGSIPHKSTLYAIAEYFNVSVDELLKSEPEEMEPADIRMIGRASQKMRPEDREHLLKYMRFMFPEAFDD